MKKIISILLALAFIFSLTTPLSTKAADWQPVTPTGYMPITWVKARGVASFMRAPEKGGYIDYLTVIYLPYNQIKLISSPTSPRAEWGPAITPFDTVDGARNWAVPKLYVEQTKAANPEAQFLWNVPFFNITLATTDLSMALKSSDAQGSYITSGSRPAEVADQPRKVLLIYNETNTAKIVDFDASLFTGMNSADQAVEGFSPTVTTNGNGGGIARLFLGVRPGGKELIVYCTNGANQQEASDALLAAGVPLENQLQADSGTSATCAYNLPGHYFVEPGRNLPYLMAAFPAIPQGTVTLDSLNVRSGPGTANKVVDKIKKGTIVKMYEEKNGWTRIDRDEQRWVSSQYVKKITR